MKKRKLKWFNIIIFITTIILLITIYISLKNIISWYIDSKKTNNELTKINEEIIINDIIDNNNTTIIPPVEHLEETNPYYSYIHMNLIDVDFTNLLSINNDTIGWIQVPGTNVNYPFVKYTDNSFYLNHSFDKSYNNAGWVFLDYRNDLNNDKHIIIYAHGRYDKTMFGTLRNITTNGWLNDQNNFIIKLSTPKTNSLWQVFSVYKIPNTSDYLKISFLNDKDFLSFTTMLTNRSAYNFNTPVYSNDKIITLSTCYDDNIKSVIHAKLIKKEDK